MKFLHLIIKNSAENLIYNIYSMRTITIILAVYLLLVSLQSIYSHEEPPKTISEKLQKDKAKIRIKSQGIKTINVYKYSDPSSDVKSSRYLYLKNSYDDNGNMTSIKRYNADGKMTDEEKYIFSSIGNMTGDIYFDSTGTEAESSEYTFDSLGCVKNAINFSEGKKESEFYYNKSGSENVLQFKKILPDGKTDYIINYVYEGDIEAGKMVKAVKLTETGDTLQKVENEYDVNGFIKIRKVFMNGKDLSYTYFYINSYSGEPIEIRKILQNEEIEYIQNFKYDLNYNLIEIIVKNNGGFIKARTEYEYVK